MVFGFFSGLFGAERARRLLELSNASDKGDKQLVGG